MFGKKNKTPKEEDSGFQPAVGAGMIQIDPVDQPGELEPEGLDGASATPTPDVKAESEPTPLDFTGSGKAVADMVKDPAGQGGQSGEHRDDGSLSKPVAPESSDSTSEKVQRVFDGKSADTTLEEGAEEIWQDFKSAMSEGGFAFGRKRIERDFKGRPEAVLEDTAEKKRFLRFSKASCLKRFFAYVWALILGTAVRMHCEENDVNVTNLDVAHLIELASEKDHLARLELAEEAQNKLLTASEIRLRVRARRKGPETAADSDLCGLAQSVIAKLDDPLTLSDDDDCSEILLDSAQVRAEFNFREQSKIYDKAERAKQHHLKLKGQIEQRLEELQRSINFLEDLMGAFDGKEPDPKTTS